MRPWWTGAALGLRALRVPWALGCRPARPPLASLCLAPRASQAGWAPSSRPAKGPRCFSSFSSFSQASVAARPPEPVDLHPPSNLAASDVPSHLITTPIISMSCHHLIPDRGSSAFPHVSRIVMVIFVAITRRQPCPLRLLHFTRQVRMLLSRYLARYLGTHSTCSYVRTPHRPG